MLTFKDISTLKGAVAVSFFAGSITMIIPLLIGALLVLHSATFHVSGASRLKPVRL
jgi:hypothetical protein